MTLLLGPPGCGKTTLLLALAGKLKKSLKLSPLLFPSTHVPSNSYNGHILRSLASTYELYVGLKLHTENRENTVCRAFQYFNSHTMDVWVHR